jgi:hypothetical protein
MQVLPVRIAANGLRFADLKDNSPEAGGFGTVTVTGPRGKTSGQTARRGKGAEIIVERKTAS